MARFRWKFDRILEEDAGWTRARREIWEEIRDDTRQCEGRVEWQTVGGERIEEKRERESEKVEGW